jgi:hypothetical protein
MKGFKIIHAKQTIIMNHFLTVKMKLLNTNATIRFRVFCHPACCSGM